MGSITEFTGNIGTKDRSVGWYDAPITQVDPVVRDLLENYSRIPSDQVVKRVVETRDKIWDIFPWPCVGQFRFVDLSLSQQPSYPQILSLLKAGNTRLLDVGCCFAQDLRKLVHDGAPSAQLFGLEIQKEFIGLAYDFFGDKDTFGGRFLNGDILDRDNAEVKELQGTFGIVQLGMVLHIWDLEGQTKACERVVELLKAETGALIVGQSVGNLTAKEFPGRPGKKIWKHDVASFEEMWREVGRRTGTKWQVRARLDEGLGIEGGKRAWDEDTTRRLYFEVERQ